MSPTRTKVEVPQLLTIEQTAEACAVTTRTVQSWIAEGSLPSVSFGRRCRRIDARDLALFVRERRQDSPKRRRA